MGAKRGWRASCRDSYGGPRMSKRPSQFVVILENRTLNLVSLALVLTIVTNTAAAKPGSRE